MLVLFAYLTYRAMITNHFLASIFFLVGMIVWGEEVYRTREKKTKSDETQ